jgi:hypothetical protein
MYLTLKEKKAAEKAAKAQAKMQAAIAQGNLDFKNMKFQVDTQYKYDKLAADRAKTDIANKLKAKGFSHKEAMDKAKLALSQDKNLREWQKYKSNPNGMSITDFIASIK